MKILAPYRKRIDTLDREIIDLLRKRYDIIDEVSAIKEKENIAPVLQDRVDEVRENAANYAHDLGLDSDFIRSLWAQIIAHSCETEENFIQKARK
ncbi:MAG: chorismate mutase [Alphaproteobacteria bacterium]|nr:chorismate mutase [Alphaproteobacteria bacterium]|tara:strand:+ start:2726 stop:3010 length:285 start_codon:yes stop_codon:yes gene_type:complete